MHLEGKLAAEACLVECKTRSILVQGYREYFVRDVVISADSMTFTVYYGMKDLRSKNSTPKPVEIEVRIWFSFRNATFYAGA